MNRSTIITIVTAALLAGCGCNDDPACRTDQQQVAAASTYVTAKPAAPVQTPAPAQARRVTVERIDVVNDTLAYNGARGIYLIRDSQTGQEFIGVSGVGVAELGDHQSGKTRARDER